jgi:O-antigen ligase
VAVTESSSKSIVVAALGAGTVVLAYLAYTRPRVLTDKTYLGGFLLIEFLFVALWMYRQVFFPLIMVAFLLAGVDLPVGAFWTQARWLFLCVGALAGPAVMMKERNHHFGLFHIVATFAAMSTLVSAAVSQYPSIALLKALSFVLLFLYAGTGARLSVTGRENTFFTGLLTGVEIFVGAIALLFAVGIEAMGNPNSLGAVMGIVGAPILLWGILLDETPRIHNRRLVLYGVCMYLAFHSHARAGLAAAFVSSGLLCLALRKYRMIFNGVAIMVICIAATAIFQPDSLTETISSVRASIYKGNGEGPILASRESPWKAAVDSISKHFWFGTGLGTTESAKDLSGHLGMFSSSSEVTAENGSSYLAILSGVGLVGALPFSLLLLLLLGRIGRTVGWMLNTESARHPAVPLAMVILAGIVHASFEDWLFAPGSYLCVLFWCMAYILVDVAPSAAARVRFRWRFNPMQRSAGGIASSR